MKVKRKKFKDISNCSAPQEMLCYTVVREFVDIRSENIQVKFSGNNT